MSRIIVAGSRDFNNYELVKNILDEYMEYPQFKNPVIVSGGARGADSLGERYAKENNLQLEIYPADWNRYGKSAGYKRNVEIARLKETARKTLEYNNLLQWDEGKLNKDALRRIAGEGE